jgi:FkbM family methyltransferase
VKNFTLDYCKVLTDAIGVDFRDNYNSDRFGPEKRTHLTAATAFNRFLAGIGVIFCREARQIVRKGLAFVEPHLNDLEWLYANLSDDESRDLLVKLSAYRSLGYRKIKLPTNTQKFWHARSQAQAIPRGEEELDADFLGWKLHERSLETFGYPIRMFTLPGACYTTFVHEQYRCETADGPIECAEGDVAIDAGGCYGDTALYLAHKAGLNGKVASFEFLPANVSIFRRNMDLNPHLASRIRFYENPVYSQSDEELFVIGNGPGTRVVTESRDPSALKVKTLKIDDLVARGDLPRIDFIKMDIEGAELEALKGSECVLRQFKPKMAITVYHSFKDFWIIPRFLHSLGLNYRFYLRHFTTHAEETVLFAVAI